MAPTSDGVGVTGGVIVDDISSCLRFRFGVVAGGGLDMVSRDLVVNITSRYAAEFLKDAYIVVAVLRSLCFAGAAFEPASRLPAPAEPSGGCAATAA